MTAPPELLVDSLVSRLADVTATEPASRFPHDLTAVAGPGLYSWWADSEARTVLGKPLGVVLPALIYAGQTGATSRTARVQRVATLQTRIGGNHLRGNAGSSTFRKTLSSLLLTELNLHVIGRDKLDEPSNHAVTRWMKQHLSIITVRVDDRDVLVELEEGVLRRLDPPLNLMGMPPSEVRQRLRKCRRDLHE